MRLISIMTRFGQTVMGAVYSPTLSEVCRFYSDVATVNDDLCLFQAVEYFLSLNRPGIAGKVDCTAETVRNKFGGANVIGTCARVWPNRIGSDSRF